MKIDWSKISEAQKPKKPYVNQISNYLKLIGKWIVSLGLRHIVIDLLIIAFIVSFTILVIRELKTEAILIEPFEVPKELEEKGYNGRVIVNKLKDQLNHIYTESKFDIALHTLFPSKNKRQNTDVRKSEGKRNPFTFTPTWLQAEQLKVEIPGAGISLHSIIQYIRKVVTL